VGLNEPSHQLLASDVLNHVDRHPAAAQQRFLAEVFGGGYDGRTIRWRFECHSSPNYDFSKNVRLE